MTVIDLGEVGHPDEPTPPAPRRPRLRRSAGHPASVALIVLVVLLTMAGAAPGPTRLAPVPVPDVPEPSHLIVGGLLVLAYPSALSPAGSRQLTAIDLADGRVRWEVSLSPRHQLVVLEGVGDDVVVTTDPGGEPVSMVLDHADGRTRWRQPGVAVPARDGGLLLEDLHVDRLAVRGVDPATGAARWTVTAGAATVGYRTGVRGVEELVVVTSAGRAEAYDVGTGVRLLAFPVPPARGDHHHVAQPVGDLLLVDGEPGLLAGYDLASGRRRWDTPVPTSDGWSVRPCGDAVCLGASFGTRVLDRVTGRERWTSDWWAPVESVAGRMIGVSADGQQGLALLDAATGRPVVELGRWEVVHQWQPTVPLLVVRPASGDRQVLAELDPTDGTVRVRDVLPGRWDACWHRQGVLVCWRQRNTLGVWRMPG
ncbi:Outer membrane protein assembly factor BamB, contains PQQ-like beta-propeller repeat [Micromonospora matsumotoense]|uniref:Outer membrane protein assembly factor BamB, contains PQQ-like beta-propeller repeat n=1 Tax=Micromonospora matsumotoense TaxID=121616 RepID=A0A1C4ZZJ8_9ACTN|nr:PQQ-binding-like beta-propeller repeat protein [Micromonospora matsumotoense]SCF38418.1 Outer membrane protein assembly factor BamB, contains PQQ-like beta-propeller repeat [Micromonospora matsumotoense]